MCYRDYREEDPPGFWAFWRGVIVTLLIVGAFLGGGLSAFNSGKEIAQREAACRLPVQ